MNDPLRQVATRDGRYSPEAFRFLLESLDHAMKLAGKEGADGPARHVTGQEVLAGMRAHGLEVFGPLGAAVWRSWGIQSALDWGHVVFLMVDAGLLKRQETDTLDDFKQGFDFDTAFQAYRAELPRELDLGGTAEPEEA